MDLGYSALSLSRLFGGPCHCFSSPIIHCMMPASTFSLHSDSHFQHGHDVNPCSARTARPKANEQVDGAEDTDAASQSTSHNMRDDDSPYVPADCHRGFRAAAATRIERYFSNVFATGRYVDGTLRDQIRFDSLTSTVVQPEHNITEG